MRKNIFLTLGATTSILIPVVSTIACSPNAPDLQWHDIDLVKTQSGKKLKATIDNSNSLFTEINEIKIANFKLGNPVIDGKTEAANIFGYSLNAIGKVENKTEVFSIWVYLDFDKQTSQFQIVSPGMSNIEISASFYALFNNKVDISSLGSTKQDIYKKAYELIKISYSFWNQEVFTDVLNSEFVTQVTKIANQKTNYQDVDLANTDTGKLIKNNILKGDVSNDVTQVLFTELNDLKISNTQLAGDNKFQIAIMASGKDNASDLNIEVVQNVDFNRKFTELIVIINGQEFHNWYEFKENKKPEYADHLKEHDTEMNKKAHLLLSLVMSTSNKEAMKSFLLEEFTYEQIIPVWNLMI